jgi:hypothetical protein
MINALLRKIRLGSYPTEFQAYLNSVQTSGHGAGPTMEEARRDFNGMSVRRPNLLG